MVGQGIMGRSCGYNLRGDEDQLTEKMTLKKEEGSEGVSRADTGKNILGSGDRPGTDHEAELLWNVCDTRTQCVRVASRGWGRDHKAPVTPSVLRLLLGGDGTIAGLAQMVACKGSICGAALVERGLLQTSGVGDLSWTC